jgi:hypothetical protein
VGEIIKKIYYYFKIVKLNNLKIIEIILNKNLIKKIKLIINKEKAMSCGGIEV